MAVTPPVESDRRRRVEDLANAVKEWAEIEKQSIDKEVTFLRAVVEGRDFNSVSYGNLNSLAGQVASELDSYLVR